MIQRPGPGSVVTVVGLARSGLAAARWLLGLGCVVRITEANRTPELETASAACAAQGAAVELGRHSLDFVKGSSLVVASPGVPLKAPPFVWAKREGIPVVSELELGSWYCRGRTIAITGSNGKSTVTTLVGDILRRSGRDCVVCGNIGLPVTGVLSQIQPGTVVVLEVSSFQLESSLSFHPDVACVLNVTENHLDRHGSWESYWAAKAKLLEHQGRDSFTVVNQDDPGARRMASRVQGTLVSFSRKKRVAGAFKEGGRLTLALPGCSGPIIEADDLPKRGAIHEENVLAAACLAGLLGVSAQKTGEVAASFQGLPHRQEVVGHVGGITFVNDSKSTTVTSGIRAIQALPGRVILIAGGRDKGSDFGKLREVSEKLKAAVLFGEDAPKIASRLRGWVELERAGNLEEAVRKAFHLAAEGEWVLLSPMCTSFDMFRDFEERGERFADLVKGLSG